MEMHKSLQRYAGAAAVLSLLVLLVCCDRTSLSGYAAPHPGQQSGGTAASGREPSLVSLSAGALIVQKPKEYDDKWSAIWLLDERSSSGWATPKGVISEQVVVIALPERTLLKTVTFDTGGIDGSDGRGANHILVEMSNSGKTSGFRSIADVSLKDRADNQTFRTTAEVPGRWVRLTIKNNHGSRDYIELCDFRATGVQLTHTRLPSVSGTYSTNYNDFHIKQEGTSVTGCYEWSEGLLDGGINGRVLTFTWRQNNGKGPAIMVFTPDGKQMIGVWWHEGQAGAGGFWNGTKKSDAVGSCPHWVGGIQKQIEKDLQELGRSRLYGINFDPDSEHIKAESKPTLDKIASLLKTRPDWKITIEGHTDSTSTRQHNQELSERRAAAVRAYLQSAGIAGPRLRTMGFGATKPVASNDTELGRAQNRRVELVKQ